MNLHTISSQVATLHGENNPLIPNREIDDAAVDLDLESCCLDGVKCSCLKKKKPYEILMKLKYLGPKYGFLSMK